MLSSASSLSSLDLSADESHADGEHEDVSDGLEDFFIEDESPCGKRLQVSNADDLSAAVRPTASSSGLDGSPALGTTGPAQQTDLEYWIESDSELDMDLQPSSAIPPPEIDFAVNNPEDESSRHIVDWIVYLLAFFQARFYLSDAALAWLLKFLSILFKVLGVFSHKISAIASLIPSSLYKHHQYTSNHTELFQKRVVCRDCYKLYMYDECLSQIGSKVVVNLCTHKAFPTSRPCGTTLMKEIVSSSGKKRFYPYSVFCFTSLISGLQNLILNSNSFINQCESTRQQFCDRGYADVYDGQLWKEFQTVEGRPFLSAANNYAILLNIDWFQPYKHTVYSVGVIYIAFTNLPRSVRFKRENIIILGIIPGPSEPSLTLNTVLSPLVSDLLDLWDGVILKLPDGKSATFRCALIGIACDLPAGRKVAGFLSFNANYGCTRCYQSFATGSKARDYSDFNRKKWKLRDNEKHRSNVKKILSCSNKTEKGKMEAKYGCRYSVLLDLPYFDPVRMLLLDPMHNLFLGTAKHMARDVWIGKAIINQADLKKIEQRIRKIVPPRDLVGRLPVTIANNTFLTAEQWMNWTLYFSVYCLHDILPTSHLQCWKDFVLGCQKLGTHELTKDDVIVGDLKLISFCEKLHKIYGQEVLTPNIHLHCHLASCIKEFGPMHSYWLFPFERYNGILGNQPTNNRSIELQLMRRFQNDNMHLQVINKAKNWPFADSFYGLLSHDNHNHCDEIESDDQPFLKYVLGCLSHEEVHDLKNVYSKMYPVYAEDLTKMSFPTTYRKLSSSLWNGKSIRSEYDRNAKNCYMLAEPLFPFTTSAVAEFHGRARPIKLLHFMQHTVAFEKSAVESRSHIFACGIWPMVHPNRSKIGKPVEIWCNNLYEPSTKNFFLPLNHLKNQVFFSIDDFCDENVLIIIPFLN